MGAQDATGAMFGPVSAVIPAVKDTLDPKSKGAPGRAAAAAYLARDLEPYVIALLEWALADDNQFVRLEAAKGLGQRGNAGSAAKLQPLLDDPTRWCAILPPPRLSASTIGAARTGSRRRPRGSCHFVETPQTVILLMLKRLTGRAANLFGCGYRSISILSLVRRFLNKIRSRNSIRKPIVLVPLSTPGGFADPALFSGVLHFRSPDKTASPSGQLQCKPRPPQSGSRQTCSGSAGPLFSRRT